MNRLCLFFILVIWISSAIFQKTYAISETSNECKERDVMQRIDSIRNTMELLLQDEKYHELVKKQNEILVLSKKLFNEESAELASEYHCLGYFLSKCEDYEEAFTYTYNASSKTLKINWEDDDPEQWQVVSLTSKKLVVLDEDGGRVTFTKQ